jgi:hypothetical protein
LYPLYSVFLLFGPDYGMFVLAGLHFLVAGLGMYLLCRELGLARAASLCGALGFELGWATTTLTTWTATLIPCAVLWSLLGQGRVNRYGFLESTESFRAHAEGFSRVEERMTLQDHIYQFGRHKDMTMFAKTATLFGVPSINRL